LTGFTGFPTASLRRGEIEGLRKSKGFSVMKQDQNNDGQEAPMPRVKSIMKGIVFLTCAFTMFFFSMLVDSCFILNWETCSFGCKEVALLATLHLLLLICVFLALKYFRRNPVEVSKTSAVASKYNDPDWCMGVGGSAGGLLGLLLHTSDVIEVFRNHTSVIFFFVMLLVGLYCYFRWRRRIRGDAWCRAYSELYRRSASTCLYIAVTSGYDRILFGRPKEPFRIRPRKPLTQDELQEELVKSGIFTREQVAEIVERPKDSELIEESKQTREVSALTEDLSVKDIPIWYRTGDEWDEGATFPVGLLPNILAEFANRENEGICIDGSEPQRVKYRLGITDDFCYYVDIIATESV
jgi:hypothetical protein